MANLVIDGQTIDDVRPGVRQRGERTGGTVRMFSGRVRSTVRTTGRVWSFQTTEQTDATGQGVEALLYSAKGVVDVYGDAVGYDSDAPLFAVIEPGETEYVNDGDAFVRVISFDVVEARPLETPLRYVPGFGNLTHSRADASLIATYTDDGGRIQTVTANGELRDDHYTADGDRATLLELSRENLLLQSEDFSTTWSASNTTVTTDQVVAPDGNMTGDKIAANGSVAGESAYQPFTTNASAVKYTASVWVRAGDFTRTDFGIFDADAGAFPNQTATVLEGDGSVSGTTRQTVTGLGSGWTRVAVTLDAAATATNTLRLYLYPGDGSATSAGYVYAWGAQAEVGAFATSYIATTTSTVTRAVDIASHVMPAAIVDPSTPWTGYFRWGAGMDGDGGVTLPRIWQTGDGGGAFVALEWLDASTLRLLYSNGLSQQPADITATVERGDLCEAIAASDGAGGFTLYFWLNGTFVDSASPTVITPASAWNPDGSGDVRVYYNSRDGNNNAGAMSLRDSKFAYRGGRVPIQADTNAQLLAMMRAL